MHVTNFTNENGRCTANYNNLLRCVVSENAIDFHSLLVTEKKTALSLHRTGSEERTRSH